MAYHFEHAQRAELQRPEYEAPLLSVEDANVCLEKLNEAFAAGQITADEYTDQANRIAEEFAALLNSVFKSAAA